MWDIAITGSVTWSSAILIGKQGSSFFCSHGSGIQWREMAIGSPQVVIVQLLSDLAQQTNYTDYHALASACRNCVVSIAGLDPRYETFMMQQLLIRIGFQPERCFVSSLAESAHVGAFLGYPGIALRCGHGSSTFARKDANTPGKLVGGWGVFARDSGCGYGLGMDGLSSIARVIDGIGEHVEEEFVERLLREMRLSRPVNIFEDLEREKAILQNYGAQKYFVELAQHIINLAKAGDAFARILVQRFCDGLIQHIHASIYEWRRYHNISLPLCIRGQILEKNTWLCRALLLRVKDEVPQVTFLQEGKNGHFNIPVGTALLAMGGGKYLHNNPRVQTFLNTVPQQPFLLPSLPTLPLEVLKGR